MLSATGGSRRCGWRGRLSLCARPVVKCTVENATEPEIVPDGITKDARSYAEVACHVEYRCQLLAVDATSGCRGGKLPASPVQAGVMGRATSHCRRS